jgi:hypothetical protein
VAAGPSFSRWRCEQVVCAAKTNSCAVADSSSGTVAFENAPSLKDAFMGIWLISRHKIVRPMVLWVLTFVVLIAVALLDRTFGPGLIEYGLGVILFLVLTSGLLFGVALLLNANRLLKSSRENRPVLYSASDSGIETTSAHARAQLDWPFFSGYVETHTLILLQLRDKKSIIIPKRCVGEENTPEFTQLLSAKLPRLRGLWLLP